MDLVEKAKTLSNKRKRNRRNITDKEQQELALAFLRGEVTIRGVFMALERKEGSNCFYPWFVVQMKGLYADKRIK